MDAKPPDVIVVGAEWPERALLRAQLIEEGYEVVAIDALPIPKEFRQRGMEPRAIVVDLRGLPEPHAALDRLRSDVPASRVLVVTALGTMAAEDVRRSGFAVVERPTTVGEIVAAVSGLLDQRPS